MKTENKIFIKSFWISGIVYAGLMASFDYSGGDSFRIFKFLFHFFIFGLFMGLLARYSHKKQLKRETNESENK